MAGAFTHAHAYNFPQIWGIFSLSQIAGISFHWQSNHDMKVILGGNIQQPARRRSIGADGIEAMGSHDGEILLHHLGFGIFLTACPWPEGTIGYSADIKLVLTQFQKFSRYIRTKT